MTTRIILAVYLTTVSLLMVWGSGAELRIDIAVIIMLVAWFLLWAYHLNRK